MVFSTFCNSRNSSRIFITLSILAKLTRGCSEFNVLRTNFQYHEVSYNRQQVKGAAEFYGIQFVEVLWNLWDFNGSRVVEGSISMGCRFISIRFRLTLSSILVNYRFHNGKIDRQSGTRFRILQARHQDSQAGHQGNVIFGQNWKIFHFYQVSKS